MLSLRLFGSWLAISSLTIAGFVACDNSAEDSSDTSGSELNSAASQAGVHENSADAQGVLALVNDRSLSVDSYVFQVRISRALAEALISTRNGTNGVNESQPQWGYPWPGSSSGGSSGYPYPVPSVDAGADEEGYPYPVPSVDAGAGDDFPSYPYPYPPVTWQLGGDDESFTRVSEVDALPGSDIAAFKNLRDYARSHGYVTSYPSYDGGVTKDAGSWPSTDGGHTTFDASAPPHHSDASAPWPTVDAGSHHADGGH